MLPPLLLDFSLPFQDPVLVVALVMLIILVAPLLLQRLRVPGMIGLILAGVAVGPHAANLLDRDPTMILLGTVGLLYLMFLAGLEINLHLFARHRSQSLVLGLLTFALPQAAGTLVAAYGLGFGWPSAILLGSVLASHTLVAYPIASRLGLARTNYATAAVGATIITDVAALLVLAVIAASTRGVLDAAFWTRLAASLAVFAFLVFWGLPRLGRWFFRSVHGGDAAFVFVLASVFLAAFLAEAAGVEAIIGAFFAGLALNRLVPESGPLMNRIAFVGHSLFIPFFLISVGMLVDLRALASEPGAWLVAGAMLATVTATKWLAAQSTRLLFGYGRDEAGVVFGLTVPQAAATLAAVLIGFEVGLFGTDVLNGAILMILVTCLAGPYATERHGRRLALRAEREPAAPAEAPPRILVPLANPTTAEALMDLAFFLRAPASQEPVLPLTVAQDGPGVAEGVAAGERLLSHAVIHAAAADVPVVPLTRVDESVSRGIVRAIRERRISTVVIGWNGQPSAQQRIFGGILDQLLEETEQLMLVCRIDHALSPTQRVLFVLPPLAEREPGFEEAARAVRMLAGQLGARLLVVAEEEHLAHVRPRLARLRPEVPTAYLGLGAWRELMPRLEAEVGEGDLLVLAGAREGTLAWRPALNRLPRVLSQRFGQANFITIYPSEAALREALPGRPLLARNASPAALTPDHVVTGLGPVPLEAALEALLARPLEGRPEERADLVARLRENAAFYSPEIRPGVALLHAPTARLERPMLLVGTSAEGLRARGASGPLHVLVVLLNPAEHEPAEHLRTLARLARLVRSSETLGQLREAASAAEVHRALATAPEPA